MWYIIICSRGATAPIPVVATAARLADLAMPTALKQAANYSAVELTKLRRGFATEGLPLHTRPPQSREPSQLEDWSGSPASMAYSTSSGGSKGGVGRAVQHQRTSRRLSIRRVKPASEEVKAAVKEVEIAGGVKLGRRAQRFIEAALRPPPAG